MPSRGEACATYPRPVARPARTRARSFVDYSLQRRAAVQALLRGAMSTSDACDAHPYLMRAARYHGEPIPRPCPICRRPPGTLRAGMVLLRYVYSDELGQYSGRLRTASEVVAMSREHGHLAVYVVEVCRDCSWNHLVASYVVGEGQPRRPPRRQRTVEDDYGY